MLLLIDGGKSAIPEVCDCLPLILTLLSTGISLVLVVIVGPSSVLLRRCSICLLEIVVAMWREIVEARAMSEIPACLHVTFKNFARLWKMTSSSF